MVEFAVQLLTILGYIQRPRVARTRKDIPLFICGEWMHARPMSVSSTASRKTFSFLYKRRSDPRSIQTMRSTSLSHRRSPRSSTTTLCGHKWVNQLSNHKYLLCHATSCSVLMRCSDLTGHRPSWCRAYTLQNSRQRGSYSPHSARHIPARPDGYFSSCSSVT